jgi:hypothetical protein
VAVFDGITPPLLCFESVTPLNSAKWHLTERAGIVSLAPSIRKWSLRFKSCYWITGSDVC